MGGLETVECLEQAEVGVSFGSTLLDLKPCDDAAVTHGVFRKLEEAG